MDGVVIPLPDGLADVAAGPELAAALAGVDESVLPGRDVPEFLRQCQRLCNWAEAVRAQALCESAVRAEADGLGREEEPGAFGSEEARAALVCGLVTASRLVDVSWDVCREIPAVHLARLQGRIDGARARAFSTMTRDLTETQRTHVVQALLAKAPGWTTGKLYDELARLCAKIDPDWARRRYAQARAERGCLRGATARAPHRCLVGVWSCRRSPRSPDGWTRSPRRRGRRSIR